MCGNEIQQVLLNLLTNARQAMPRGGRITIRIAPDPAAGTVDLTVRDTGSGIPAEVLPRIFDRYFTTKQGPDASGKGGTGVGLSDVPRDHRSPSRQDPRRKHRRRRHGVHAQTACRQHRCRDSNATDREARHSRRRRKSRTLAPRRDRNGVDRPFFLAPAQ